MKVFLVLACAALAAAAPEPPSGYGYPSGSSINAFGGGGGGGYDSGSNSNTVGNLQGGGGQTHRHIYIHVAPDDPEDQQARVVRIPSKNDKHVNIIFVKTPSNSASQQTEVILPEQDEQKNIVYVLVRKFDPTTDLKIRAPRPTSPSKPQVYFIRYKNNEQQQGGQQQQGGGQQQQQPPAPVYGTPF
ncbi:hypothetical protein Ocin01_05561 [Orchesella cincta]|uniref:DUF243 domain-containing protein n=1 Tax=Orchesella cincta TaxID=48709 RepID=A0A1D2N787_ORCCI|nr:hypothetical protein Ocin01_05561 [Orchesella cincta]